MIEIKLEVGLGSVTKSVFAMCLSDITADVKNWSSNVSLNFISLFTLTFILSLDATLINDQHRSGSLQ